MKSEQNLLKNLPLDKDQTKDLNQVDSCDDGSLSSNKSQISNILHLMNLRGTPDHTKL